MSAEYPTEGKRLLEKLDYDNVFFPFQDKFRQDRLVAFSHKTGNRIEIYDMPYVSKYNENDLRMLKVTTAEYNAIKSVKEEMGWNTEISLDYVTTREEEY